MLKRRKTSEVNVGGVLIGGNNPIVIQSMTNTPTKSVDRTIAQIKELSKAGASLVRIAVQDMEDADSLSQIVQSSFIPLIADIHFDYQLALKAIDAGVAGLRLNPGNIRKKSEIVKIVEKAGANKIPIRIGVNAGSLDHRRFPQPDAESMVQSALEHIKLLEELNFYHIKVSLKSADVKTMIQANRQFANERDYPLHLGVTEPGTIITSAVRSAMGIGTLLMEGIGDTIRVSVAGNPVSELPIAREILISLRLKSGIKFIACPTCGRTEADIEAITIALQNRFGQLQKNLTIAVMGCVVNGPGEARTADIALIGGKSESLIYQKGEFIKKIDNEKILPELEKMIQKMV